MQSNEGEDRGGDQDGPPNPNKCFRSINETIPCRSSSRKRTPSSKIVDTMGTIPEECVLSPFQIRARNTNFDASTLPVAVLMKTKQLDIARFNQHDFTYCSQSDSNRLISFDLNDITPPSYHSSPKWIREFYRIPIEERKKQISM